MKNEDFPAPEEGFVVTLFIASKDVKASAKFYSEVFGGKIVMDSEPSIVKLANTWIIINQGGGPTDDKPDYFLESPTPTQKIFNSFLNIRVADIEKSYKEWKSKGAEFLTAPIKWNAEIRCYIKDPDGYIIEVGQAIGF